MENELSEPTLFGIGRVEAVKQITESAGEVDMKELDIQLCNDKAVTWEKL